MEDGRGLFTHPVVVVVIVVHAVVSIVHAVVVVVAVVIVTVVVLVAVADIAVPTACCTHCLFLPQLLCYLFVMVYHSTLVAYRWV